MILRSSLRLLAVLSIFAFGALLAPAYGQGSTGSPEALKQGKTSLKIVSKGQREILKKGLVVKVGSTRKKVKLKARSSTFDAPRKVALARPKKVKIPKSGKKRVKLRLSKANRKAITSCEAREIQVSARKSKTTVELVRDTAGCKAKPVDLSAADRCDFIGDQSSSLCLLPFPDDYYTVNDSSTATGKRIDLKTAATPANEAGVNIEAAPYNFNDGFSPGQSIVVKVPGLDRPAAFTETAAVPVNRLSEYSRSDAPVVVIDATTGERWPIWVEIDSNATDPDRAALLIHPARNFASGHRYIVAMRNLKRDDGSTIAAPNGFRYFRDDLPSKERAIKSQRDRFERIFRPLRRAGIKRANLYLAWDFTVASDENIAGRILHMRDESLAGLGDTTMADLQVQGSSPSFTVTTTQNFPPGPGANMARRVQGTFQVPCYMQPDCESGGRFDLDAQGLPQMNGTYTANFNCMIPFSSLSAPARPSLYGHGLLGSANEATSSPQQTLGNTHNIVSCATDEIGLSGEDLPNTAGILSNFSKFPELADRLQQGLLNEIFLGRLMIHAQGFASVPDFRVDDTQPVSGANPSVIDPQRLYYNGNSQGAIQGGALTAIAPDFTRATLGVGGMNYSVLLNRSVDFDLYATLIKPSYADELERPLILSLVQMLWDRGESNGYANRMTTNPLPNTPAHEVLMNVGLGDHQVSNFTADTMARTIGAQVRAPVAYDGRWPDIEQVWDVPRIAGYPYKGSALVYWDSGPIRDDPGSVDPADMLGTNVPPIANVPNRDGEDPHELPRRTPAEQQMVSDFLQLDAASQITDTCNGSPCYDFTFAGP